MAWPFDGIAEMFVPGVVAARAIVRQLRARVFAVVAFGRAAIAKGRPINHGTAT